MTRFKKIIDKFEKKSISNKNWVNNWVKIINKSLLLLVRSFSNKNASIALLVRSLRKEFEVRVYIKKKEKIKRIIITTINNIISRIRDANVGATLLVRKNIIIVKRQFNIVIFKVKIKKSKRILKKNNFWTKKILSNASLRETNYNIIIYEIKVENMLKNIKKDDTKIFI